MTISQILHKHFYGGGTGPTVMKFSDAEEAILELVQKCVPHPAYGYTEDESIGWNGCREVMLDNLKRLIHE